LDHGTVTRTVDTGPEAPAETLRHLTDLGIDMHDVAKTLENEGVASFAKSFDDLMESLEKKAEKLRSEGAK
jgi:transaldolase